MFRIYLSALMVLTSYAVMAEWRYVNTSDELSGDEYWYAVNEENTYKDEVAKLMIICKNNNPSIMVLWPQYMWSIGDTNWLWYRIDENKVESEIWKSTNQYATYRNKSAKKNIKFLVELAKAKNIVIRSEKYNKEKFTAKFDLDGVDSVVSNLKKDCLVKEKYWK